MLVCKYILHVAKVHSNLLSYVLYTYDTQHYWVHLFCTENEIDYFEENNFNERFGECSGFLIKRPDNVECCMYKVTK